MECWKYNYYQNESNFKIRQPINACWYTRAYQLSLKELESAIRVQILNEAVNISLSANILIIIKRESNYYPSIYG